jgi:hypothetical protein
MHDCAPGSGGGGGSGSGAFLCLLLVLPAAPCCGVLTQDAFLTDYTQTTTNSRLVHENTPTLRREAPTGLLGSPVAAHTVRPVQERLL